MSKVSKPKRKRRMVGPLRLGRKARPLINRSPKSAPPPKPPESVTDLIKAAVVKGDRVVCIVLPKTKSMLWPYKGAELYVFK